MIVVNEMEKLAYSEKKIEKNPWLMEDDDKPAVPKVKIILESYSHCRKLIIVSRSTFPLSCSVPSVTSSSLTP